MSVVTADCCWGGEGGDECDGQMPVLVIIDHETSMVFAHTALGTVAGGECVGDGLYRSGVARRSEGRSKAAAMQIWGRAAETCRIGQNQESTYSAGKRPRKDGHQNLRRVQPASVGVIEVYTTTGVAAETQRKGMSIGTVANRCNLRSDGEMWNLADARHSRDMVGQIGATRRDFVWAKPM